MGRIKIDFPEVVLFSTEMPIRISDINYGGHLGNDAVLAIVHEARLRALKEKGFSELDVGGTGLIMADAAVVYRSEAFHGETLVVDVALVELSKYGFDFVYRLRDKATARDVAFAKTGMVFFDYSLKRISKTPDAFKTAFSLH